MEFLTVDRLAFMFGLLGNIVSFMVFLAPVPTFYIICKKKSSEGYQSLPYVIALTSAMLLLFYAYLKTNALLIVTINLFGCVIELTYLTIYLFFAPNKTRLGTMKLILLFNVAGNGLTILITFLLVKEPHRVTTVGWVCAVYNLAVFASPLSIMKQVIRTRSVEFMPFTLSFFLTLCAIMWFFYGLLIKDFFIALPNVAGFVLGIAQMLLYMVYKNASKDDNEKPNQLEQAVEAADMKMTEMENAMNPNFHRSQC